MKSPNPNNNGNLLNTSRFGDVSYQLSRVFLGSRTANELLIDAVVERARAENAVDARESWAV